MLKRGFQFAPGYRLQEFLGRGQFGQVWRATAPGGAAAAVKFIDLSGGQGQKEYEGVKRVKQIRHANLMPITAIWLLDAQGKVIEEAPDEAMETIDLSVAEPKGQSALFPKPGVEPSWLVVSMLLGGKSLQQRLRECVDEGLPGIPPKELISYMDEAAKGIDFLNAPQHDLGDGPISIQHSDVKPANIVLIGSSAVVCDFGLARILSRNQVTATSAAGTPAYMAPEAISGKPSRTCDQYSLAVTYYHLRTGSLPVSDGSLWEVLDAHRQGNLKLGLVSEAEQAVLRKATDLDWEKRFESNVDMVDALRETLRVEGHTKAGFVPNDRQAKSAGLADGETKAVKGDPTATIDLPATSAAADQALQETAPLVHAQSSTQEGFLKETLPALQESPATIATVTASDSMVDSIKRNPKAMLGVGVGAVIVLLLGAIAMRPGPSPQGGIHQGGGNGETVAIEPEVKFDPVPPATMDPAELVREAVALLDKDQLAAIAKFKSALDLDPGLELPEPLKMPGHKGAVMKMLQAPSGSQLVSVADDPTPFLWNLATSDTTPIRLSGHEGLISDFAISPKGERLLVGSSDDVGRVWNLKAGNVASTTLELKGHQDKIEAVVWHPTEPIAVTASADLNIGVWEIGLATGEHPNGTIANQRLIPIQETLTALATDPTGKWLAARTIGADAVEQKVGVVVYPWTELINVSGSPPPIRLDAKYAKRIAFIAGQGEPMLVIGDAGGAITLHETKTGEMSIVMRKSDAHSADVEAIRVVRVDQRDVIVSGSADGSVHWWKYGGTQESLARSFSPQGVGCVDVAGDGRWVAAGANDGSVWLWDTNARKELGAIRFLSGAGSVDSVLIDVQSNWLIAGCDDGVVRMWDLKLAKLLALTIPTRPSAKVDGPMTTIQPKPLAMR